MTAPAFLGRRRRRGGTQFNPLQLFANGEAGVFYDPGDLTAEKVAWRRNLLTWSEQFDNAAWSVNAASVTANAGVAPDGTTTADKLIEDGATSVHFIRQTVNQTVSVAHTATVYAKAAERQWIAITSLGRTPTDGASEATAWFNLSAGTIGTVTTGGTATIENVGNGWYRCQMTPPASASAQREARYSVTTGDGVLSYAGNGTSGILVWGGMLNLGTTASAYQRITDFTSDFLAAFPTHALYQDAAGSTPVTALGQPVGLTLDKSRGGLANVGAELVTNGDFSGGTTGWSTGTGWSISSGRANCSNTIATGLIQNAVFVSGKTYRVTFEFNRTAGSLAFWIAGTQLVQSGINTSGTKTFHVSATTSGSLFLESSSGTNDFWVDNISVREVPGVHAIQPTSASRPALDARVNLLTYSEQFDNAAWLLQTATVAVNSTAAPDGTTTADTLSASATEGFLYRSFTAAATPYVWSIFAKANTTSTVRLDAVTGGFAAGASCTFTLTGSGAAGTVTHYGTTTGFVASIVSVGNGWYRCALTGTATATTWFHETMVAGSGNSVFAWGADLRLATDAAYPYQRVAAATDYADVGVPRAFAFDGFDDSLYTASNMDLSGTDKMTVLAGVRKLSDAAAGAFAELSNNFNSNANSFALFIGPAADSIVNFAMLGKTSPGIYNNAEFTDAAAPTTSVLSTSGDKAVSPNAVLYIRRNGVAQSLTRPITNNVPGNFGSYVFNIGRRGNTSVPFNGKAYQLIVRGALTDTATLAQAERYVGAKTGLYL